MEATNHGVMPYTNAGECVGPCPCSGTLAPKAPSSSTWTRAAHCLTQSSTSPPYWSLGRMKTPSPWTRAAHYLKGSTKTPRAGTSKALRQTDPHALKDMRPIPRCNLTLTWVGGMVLSHNSAPGIPPQEPARLGPWAHASESAWNAEDCKGPGMGNHGKATKHGLMPYTNAGERVGPRPYSGTLSPAH